jgi:hypothetical protein
MEDEMTFVVRSMLSFALILVCANSAHAGGQCDLNQVVNKQYSSALAFAVESGKRQEPLYKELNTISAKAKDSTKPIGAQLSLADTERFQTVSTRLLFMRMENLIESEHGRDAFVIQKLVTMQKNIYAGAAPPQESDADFIYHGLVTLWSTSNEQLNTQITAPRDAYCTFDLALFKIENDALDRMHALNSKIASLNEQLNAIAARYGKAPGERLDPTQMSPYDKQQVEEIVNSTDFVAADRETSFVEGIEDIRTFAAVSDLIYGLHRKDLVESGGDPEAIGASVSKGNFDDRTKFFISMWDAVNEKVPSEAAKEAMALAGMMKANGIK